MTPKISLFKYITGQLDIEQIRAANGLGPSQRTRKMKVADKPSHPSAAKGNATDKATKAAANATANPNFTAAEDARILEWKAANEGKPWKALADELGKGQTALKERYKQLRSEPKAGDSEVDAADKRKDGTVEAEKKKEKAASAKGGDKGKGGKEGVDAEQAELVRFFVKEDEEDKWLRVASRLFDRTGKAIHPDDLKEKYGKK